MDLNEDIELLGEYSVFLEDILNSGDKNLSEMSILEIVDDRFAAACDFFRNRQGARLNVITEKLFDNLFYHFPFKILPYVNICDIPYKLPDFEEYYSKMSFVYGIDVVYAQMPIKNHEEVIRKLSLVPSKSGAVAIFGFYSYKDDGLDFNCNLINAFVKCLQSKGLDYKKYTKETSDKYFELVISKKAI